MTPEQHANTVRVTTAEHVARVEKAMWAKAPRNGLERDHDDYDWLMEQGKESLAALVALAERADTLERERDEALAKIDRLVSRGIEDLRFSLDEAEKALHNAALFMAENQAEAEQARAEADRLREALRQIKANAIAWHGVAEPDNGHAKALRVIAVWCDDALDPHAALDGPQTKEQT